VILSLAFPEIHDFREQLQCAVVRDEIRPMPASKSTTRLERLGNYNVDFQSKPGVA
jgi:hypothetical protein